MQKITTTQFKSYKESVKKAFDAIDVPEFLSEIEEDTILIKPNLVNSSPPPVTTPVECCETIINYIRPSFNGKMVIAEGSGAADMDTPEIFEILGYNRLADRTGLDLIDLNTASTVTVSDPECDIFPQMHLPEIAFKSCIISVPVLKAHSLADITGSLKNMLGFAPPKHYQSGGHWKKSAFHRHMHQSIVELNKYISADLTLMDGSVGLAEYHLGGAQCNPPANCIIAGYNPKDVDRQAAGLLDRDWQNIPHLL